MDWFLLPFLCFSFFFSVKMNITILNTKAWTFLGSPRAGVLGVLGPRLVSGEDSAPCPHVHPLLL